MTYDEIVADAKHELHMNKVYGRPTIDEIHDEFIELCVGGHMSVKKAEKVFESIVKE